MSTATKRFSSHRRRLQFRLRSMLAAMLLVCLGLTLWSVYIRPYRQEARIIAQLQEHGAVVTTETLGPVWLRGIAGDEFFRRIVKAELSDPRVVDEDLRLLTGAPRLRQLMIDAPGRITSEGLRNLTCFHDPLPARHGHHGRSHQSPPRSRCLHAPRAAIRGGHRHMRACRRGTFLRHS